MPDTTTSVPIISSNSPIISSNSPIISSGSPVVLSNSPIMSSNSPIMSSNSPIISTSAPTISTGPFDLVQSIITTNTTNKNTPQDIQNSVSSLYRTLASLNNNSNAALNGQDVLNNIITNETDYLTNNINEISEQTESAKRIVQLNEYSRLRSADYYSILYYIIGTIIIVNILFILKKNFPIISKDLIELTIIILVSICLYIIFLKMKDIQRRDTIYYDELAVPNPTNINLDNNQINSVNAANGISSTGLNFNGINTCSNETCCDNRTSQWDSVLQQCVSTEEEASLLSGRFSTKSPTTIVPKMTMTPTIKNGFTLMNEIQPNSYFEFSNYSLV